MTKKNKDYNFSSWYKWVIKESEIIDDRYPIKGMPVYHFYGFFIIRKIFDLLKEKLDKEGFKEVWFPILITSEIFKKEKEHIKGFEKEIFYVKPKSPTKDEKNIYYILRPTSETEMYYMFSLWIKSYKDLPILTYMINTVYRYETKATRPLIRGREILWMEKHTVHKDIDDAKKMIKRSMEIYSSLFWNDLSIPHIWIIRPDWDKFAGADITFAADTILPDGKFLQIATTHFLGRNFSKAYNILFNDKHPYVKIDDNTFEAINKDGKGKFLIKINNNNIEVTFYENSDQKAKIIEKIDKNIENLNEDNENLIYTINKIIDKNFPKEKIDLNNNKYAWQTCFGMSMRVLAAIIGIHGDNNGLILPFKISPFQFVIIPIYYSEDEKIKIFEFCKYIEDILKKENYRVYFDCREDKSPGWKFNYWEIKGTPFRIEIGSKEVEKRVLTIFNRITYERKEIYLENLSDSIKNLIDEYDRKLKERSKEYLDKKIIKTDSFNILIEAINKKKALKVPFCMNEECGKKIKERLNIDIRGYDINPEDASEHKCIFCGNKAKYWCYVGKSY